MLHRALEAEWELDSGSDQGTIASSPLPHAMQKQALLWTEGKRRNRCLILKTVSLTLKTDGFLSIAGGKSRWPLGISNNARLLTWHWIGSKDSLSYTVSSNHHGGLVLFYSGNKMSLFRVRMLGPSRS